MNEANPGMVELFGSMAAQAAELKTAARGSVPETVAGWVAPEYAAEAYNKVTLLGGNERLSALQEFMNDWIRLRRNELAVGRLQLRREELEWQRTNGKLVKEKEFEEWMKRPEIQEKYFPKNKGITPETLRKIEEELRLL